MTEVDKSKPKPPNGDTPEARAADETLQRADEPPLLEVRELVKYYPVPGSILPWHRQTVRAVDRVSFSIRAGETLGLVGESGCGKSTIGRLVVALERPTSGKVIFDGKEISSMSERELHPLRPSLQMIFQDNYSALNPRKHIRDILSEPMLAHGLVPHDTESVNRRVDELLDMVGLPRTAKGRYPHEFSGGQRQRIGIARALSLNPRLIVCDEPVSALDVSIQAQILNLLRSLQTELGLTLLFIGHGLGAVRYVSDRIAVMYMGQLLETAPAAELFRHPVHPYTKALCDAVPNPDPRSRGQSAPILEGEIGSNITPPSGCRFHPRCPYAVAACSSAGFNPRMIEMSPDHMVACEAAESNRLNPITKVSPNKEEKR